MLTLQVQYSERGRWITIQQVNTLECGLHRLAYFYEHYYPPNEYRLIDEQQTTVNHGRKQVVCSTCHQRKFLAQELYTCHSCL